MERIKLTRDEKTVLRLLHNGCGCPDDYPRHMFVFCVCTLEEKGLAKGAWSEGGKVEDARITPFGKCYLGMNPKLRNPMDWGWVILITMAMTAVATSIALIIKLKA